MIHPSMARSYFLNYHKTFFLYSQIPDTLASVLHLQMPKVYTHNEASCMTVSSYVSAKKVMLDEEEEEEEERKKIEKQRSMVPDTTIVSTANESASNM